MPAATAASLRLAARLATPGERVGAIAEIRRAVEETGSAVGAAARFGVPARTLRRYIAHDSDLAAAVDAGRATAEARR